MSKNTAEQTEETLELLSNLVKHLYGENQWLKQDNDNMKQLLKNTWVFVGKQEFINTYTSNQTSFTTSPFDKQFGAMHYDIILRHGYFIVKKAKSENNDKFHA